MFCLWMAHVEAIGTLAFFKLVSAYFIGSIPFGFLLSKFFGGIDVRKIGSGNIGATNVLRSGKKFLALLTLILDSLKGVAAVLVASHQYYYTSPGSDILSPYSQYNIPDSSNIITLISAGFVIVGHMYPIWLDFKGGKGIATILGVLICFSWKIAILSVIVWIVVAKITKISSLAGIVSVTVAPIVAYFFENKQFSGFLFVLAVLIYIRHFENIKRLISGKEPRIGEREQN